VLARSQDIDIHCGEIMRDALAAHGVRGGGSPDLAQGDLPADEVVNFLAAMSQQLRDMLAQDRVRG
jgi:alanyl-tRNA synthetase